MNSQSVLINEINSDFTCKMHASLRKKPLTHFPNGCTIDLPSALC
jgi:hypothetical protein